MKNTIIKDAAILFVITLIAGVALGAVHAITLEPINQAQIAATNATYAEVYPEAVSFENTDELTAAVEAANADIEGWGLGNKSGKLSINDAMIAKDASGSEVGYMIISTSGEGYGGDIKMTVGVSNDGKVTGIGFLTINETVGLGLKAKDASFRDQFVGKDATGSIEMIKSGTATDKQFNAISGASFTSGAVEKATNAALYFVNNYVK
ncbi:MAG: FMN-binding protein [Clostridiales bacterium]|nr:FMN-binding protein [Clostridiales bacterium]